MTGRGGWPMTVFLAPDGRPFFGGTYFPKEERHGMPGFVTVLEAVDEAWRSRRDDLLEQAGKLTKVVERTGSLGATGDGPAPSSRRSRTGVRLGADAVRRAVRRVRAGAEVPAGDDARLPAPHLRPQRGSRDARHGARVARRHGRGWNVRPGRRRLPSLLDRRPLARPPLREDALRPGAPHQRVPARAPRDGRAAIPARRRGDDRVRPARPASREGRLLLGRGRRLGGRRGQVLPVVPRGDRAHRRRRRGRGRPLLRRDRGRQLRGPAHRLPREHPPRRRPGRGAARGGAAGGAEAVRRARAAGPSRARRQGAAGLERVVPALAGGGGGRVRTGRLDGRGAHTTRGSC